MSENISNGTAGSTTDHLRTSYSHAKEAVRQVVGTARERAGNYFQQGKEKATDVEQKVESFVRDQPIKSLLIAVGAGLLLGVLLRRR